MLREFSSESEKNLWLGNFKNYKLNKRLPKKIRKLDVDAFREEGKRFKSQIQLSLAETRVHQSPQAKFEFKGSSIEHKNFLI